MNYSPWADAAERHPDVQIERCDIAPARGVWVPSERVIMLNTELDRADRRATLAHELCHVDLNHQPLEGWFGRRMEREADRLAARRLLSDVEQIASVLHEHGGDLEAAAADLDVPARVLGLRLDSMTDEERAELVNRVTLRDPWP